MAECFIVRRGGQTYQLPELDSSWPQDATVVASASGSASFAVRITQPGTPAEYTYQWYKDGEPIQGETGSSVTITGLTEAASHTVYCEVTNKAGTVTSRVATLTVEPGIKTLTLFDNGAADGYTWSTVENGKINHVVNKPSSGTAETVTQCTPAFDFTQYKTLYMDVYELQRNSSVYYGGDGDSRTLIGSISATGVQSFDVTEIIGTRKLLLYDAISSSASFAVKSCQISRVWLTDEEFAQNAAAEMATALKIMGVTVDE